MDADEQALLNYLLGGGIQQEKPQSHVIRQEQTRYVRTKTTEIPVPTHEEIEEQRQKEAAKKDGSAAPQSFSPMDWGKLPATHPQQPQTAAEPAAPPKKVSAPLWERMRQKR